jgi:sialidase-1
MKCLETGLIYRNPKPHIRSVHAYFPSVIRFEDGELVCTLRLGQAFEAHDLRTYVARSKDDGKTWDTEGTIYPGTSDRCTSDSARLTLAEDDSLVVFMIRQDRKRKDEGLTNPETQGYVEQELIIMKSYDRGRTWTEPKIFTPPLKGPCFELCCPIIPLSSGKWIIPTSTWQDWDGYCPNGLKMVAFASYDKGNSWPDYSDVMVNFEDEITFWESKIVEMKDGRLLAVAWAYDRKNKRDLPNHYALSEDGGKTFKTPLSTGLCGQTLTPLVLSDGRILNVYRRMDKQGLWAVVSRIDGEKWVNEEELCLWGQGANKLVETGDNMSKNFNVLKFGAPSLVNMGDGTVFAAFWAVEDCVSNVRWYKIKI